MKLQVTKKVPVEAKTLKISIKVCDQFAGQIVDQNGEILREFDDIYVPDFMPGEHYGDYLILYIDLDSGQITNWKQPTTEEMEAFIAEGEWE